MTVFLHPSGKFDPLALKGINVDLLKSGFMLTFLTIMGATSHQSHRMGNLNILMKQSYNRKTAAGKILPIGCSSVKPFNCRSTNTHDNRALWINSQ